MTYHLFLDDVRNPGDVTWAALPSATFFVVRNYDAFVHHITLVGIPSFVAFDHDLADAHYAEMLKDCMKNNNGKPIFEVAEVIQPHDYGEEKTGYDCAKWLVNYCHKEEKPFPEYIVHSMNPVGKARIEGYIASARKVGYI